MSSDLQPGTPVRHRTRNDLDARVFLCESMHTTYVAGVGTIDQWAAGMAVPCGYEELSDGFDWVVRAGCVQLEQPPEGTEWRLVDQDLDGYLRDASWIGQVSNPARSALSINHERYCELNPVSVPVIEPCMWVKDHPSNDPRYLLHELDGGFIGMFHNGVRWVPMRLCTDDLSPCEPPDNAAELFVLLGIDHKEDKNP